MKLHFLIYSWEFFEFYSSSVIYMGHVELAPYEGFVIALDWGTTNDEEEE